jgi:hypothetical protein
MPSRTSVVSLNITLAPARTSRSVQKPTAGLAVTPLKASLPPHCTPTTSSLAGTVSRRRAFRRCRCTRPGAGCVDHRHEADVRVVLQADHVQRLGLGLPRRGSEAARRQQPLGLQLLAAQADHHHLAAEVGVQADVAQRADGDGASGASMATPQP